MLIHTLPVGELETNCYLVEDEKSREVLIIDPGDEAPKILKVLRERKLKPLYIINTHGHPDHASGNLELKEKIQIPILIHEFDASMLSFIGSPKADRFLKDGDQINLGGLTFKVLHTPGHTPGSISLYSEVEKVLFSGDTLFAGGIGRIDLPYSSPKDMAPSLKKLLSLPPETKVYPGHGGTTTIGEERKQFL